VRKRNLSVRAEYRTKLLIFSSDFDILKVTSKKGGIVMSITATELKNNLSKYLLLASKEDVYITQYGKVIAKLTNPFQDRLDIAESLFGSVPATMTLEEAREERLDKI